MVEYIAKQWDMDSNLKWLWTGGDPGTPFDILHTYICLVNIGSGNGWMVVMSTLVQVMAGRLTARSHYVIWKMVVPCISKPSATIVLTTEDNHGEGFHRVRISVLRQDRKCKYDLCFLK